MATIEHCLYCFESLAGKLESVKPLTLAELQESWAEYVKANEASGNNLSKRLPALDRVAGSSSSSASSSGTSTPASTSTSTLSSGADTAATSTSSLPAESPLFVTWNKKSRHGDDYNLRGCIGTFEAQELESGLSMYALTSALHDTRFDPVSLHELPALEVAVTLLTDFEDADGPDDWILGTHGLRLSFVYHGRRFGSTYLPDVAVEQGWDKEETVVSLMRKAGWMGRKDRWRDVDLKVVRYQGKKVDCTYDVYRAWKDWDLQRA
jgi:uncharacterized protein (TIGR00296 family)